MEIEKMMTSLGNARTNTDILKILSESSTLIKNLDIKFKESSIDTSKALWKLKNPQYCQALITTIEKLSEQGYGEVAKALIKDIIISRGGNQGKLFEMMTYYCFIKKGIRFKPQPRIEAENCFKNSGDGYDADGEILELDCVFDVKEFGIGFPHIKDFRMRLQEQVNQLFSKKIKEYVEESNNTIRRLEQEIDSQTSDDLKNTLKEEINKEKRRRDRMKGENESKLWEYTITVDGLINMGMDELANYIKSASSIAEKLVNRAWEERMNRWEDDSAWSNENPVVKHGLGFWQEHINNLGLTCTLESKIAQEMRGTSYMNVYEIDAYQWAMNNKFYFMGDASQFVRNKPYMIICVLDRHDNMFLRNVNDYDIYFRPLCRRMFVELNRMTDRNIQTSFDGKAKSGFSVSEAVKKITGIIFLETSELMDTERTRTPMWIYLNPNADNPLLNCQVHQLCLMMPEIIEDYKYDNY